MVTAVEAISSRAREGLCFILGNIDDAARVLGNITGLPGGIGGLAGALGTQLCNKEPEPLPPPEPVFEGGQCTGTSYQVDWSFTREDGLSFTESVINFPGPVLPAVWGGPGPSDETAVENCNLIGGTYRRYLIRSGATGQELGLIAGCNATLNSFSLTPLYGGPNNCGDPPVTVPPPGNVTYEGDDITYEGDDNVEITVPIAFIFAPAYVAIDGTLKVPVTIDVGGINFNGEATIAPEFKLEIKPTFNPPGPGVPDDPDAIGEPGEPSTPIDDPEELESTIVGVLVFSDIDPDGEPSGILFPTGPNLYVPRLASVQFAVKTANSIGWTADQDVKNLECYVPCPAPQGAIAVRVSSMPGVTSRFTAVRGKPLTSF